MRPFLLQTLTLLLLSSISMANAADNITLGKEKYNLINKVSDQRGFDIREYSLGAYFKSGRVSKIHLFQFSPKMKIDTVVDSAKRTTQLSGYRTIYSDSSTTTPYLSVSYGACTKMDCHDLSLVKVGRHKDGVPFTMNLSMQFTNSTAAEDLELYLKDHQQTLIKDFQVLKVPQWKTGDAGNIHIPTRKKAAKNLADYGAMLALSGKQHGLKLQQQAMFLDPENPYHRFNYAAVMGQIGMQLNKSGNAQKDVVKQIFDAVVKDCTKVIEMTTGNKDYKLLEGHCNFTIGDAQEFVYENKEKAMEYYHKALLVMPKHPEAASSIKRLEKKLGSR